MMSLDKRKTENNDNDSDMVDFRKSVLHAHQEDEDDDDLDNENSLKSIEAKLDRALNDVSHLTVDNLATSLSQSLVSGDLPSSERQLFFSENTATPSTTGTDTTDTSDVVSLASSLAHLVQTMNLGDEDTKRNRNPNAAMKKLFSGTSNASSDQASKNKGLSRLLDFSTSEDFSLNVTPPPAFPPPPPPPTSDVPMSENSSENKNSPSSNMSVSEPNLSASEASAVSLLETFAAVARRRTSTTSTVTSTNSRNQTASSGNSSLFGTKRVSSLVRLAISSNFPASLLNSAQSYPSLGASGAAGTPGQPSVGQVNPDTEQVSLEEFLESCRATSLLAELEDDEELPDADEDDNDDDANDDEDDYDENYDEESSGLELQHRNSSSRRKTWDEEHVIKRKFSALIPAFDPRPGRTNVAQTSDLEVPAPGEDIPTITSESTPGYSQRLSLTLRGPNLPGAPDVEVDLASPDWTIFKAVQEIAQKASLGTKTDKTRRVWEPTYVIVYREVKETPGGQRPTDALESLSCSRRSSSLPQLPLT